MGILFNAFTKTRFDLLSRNYDAVVQSETFAFREPSEVVSAFLQSHQCQLKEKTSETCEGLDIGAGTGQVAEALLPQHQECIQILGVDISPRMIAVARRKRLYDDLLETDGTTLPREMTSTFDYVFMSSFMQFVSNPQALFSEVFRVLKPGALVSFSFDLARDGRNKEFGSSGYFLFSKGFILNQIDGAGLQLVSMRETKLRREPRRGAVKGAIVDARKPIPGSSEDSSVSD